MKRNGILNITKPVGQTSMDVVRFVKRLTEERKVGHGGTLDPIAGGVLPIFIGQATRLMEPLIDGRKVYKGKIRLGAATQTYDACGDVTETGDPSGITRKSVEEAFKAFLGPFIQIPPMYSALKRNGERLYDLARAGFEVPREGRLVEVFRINILSYEQPDLEVEIECGRGVYIRSIAHDLGEALGCWGHLTALTRMKTGPFMIEQSVTVDEFSEAVRVGTWADLLYPMDVVVGYMKYGVIGQETETWVRQGGYVDLTGLLTPDGMTEEEEQCRLYNSAGLFLGLAKYDKRSRLWKPNKIFSTASL